ncbi:MAG: tetratricopeptide repeat protein [Candidatus Thorarchaeota archaeon]
MYEKYEPSDKIFVDREEYLDWMQEALKRCKEKSVVLHLRGIGGIGKSSLQDHWTSTIESTIRLDCSQYSDFYTRLNVLAKGALLLGIRLQRFDVLWQIRQRFVEGVEPVREEGREWAKEIVMAIPFIGSLASIGSAITAVGAKVAPKLKGKYGLVATWLQSRMGKNHLEKLLEILWKEPRRAEFLFLDALLEDLNSRKLDDNPILFLFDHYETVDSIDTRWRYSGKKITESELWYVFLCSLKNCVGVVASRRLAPQEMDTAFEESELTELDQSSCIELLGLHNVTDEDIQEKIISISGGNPFVIDAICDMTETGLVSVNDIESLRAETLEEVRLKTWRKLFSQAQDLLGVVDRAGLLPFFDRHVMNIIYPEMKTDQWDRLIHLSFVRNRGDGTWVLHDLARELVITELGPRLKDLTSEVAENLEIASVRDDDFTLLGLSLSVQALASPSEARERFVDRYAHVFTKPIYSKFHSMLEFLNLRSEEGQLDIMASQGWILVWHRRFAEAEHLLSEAVSLAKELSETRSTHFRKYIAHATHSLATLMAWTNRPHEAELMYKETIEIFEQLDRKNLEPLSLLFYYNAARYYGIFLTARYRLKDAEDVYKLSIEVSKDFTIERHHMDSDSMRGGGLYLLSSAQMRAGNFLRAEGSAREGSQVANIFVKSCSLQILGHVLCLAGRPKEAEDALRETVGIRREFYKGDADMMWGFLAESLNRLALTLLITQRFSDSEEIYDESLSISREQLEKTSELLPRIFIGWTIGEMGILYKKTGRTLKAEEAYVEALEIWREAASHSEDRYRDDIARCLSNLGALYSQTDRISESENAYQEAIEIARELSKTHPESVFMSALVSTILNNKAILQRQTGSLKDAKETHLEAIQIRRELAEKSPEFFIHRLSTSLNNLGILLTEKDEFVEAEEAFREALSIRRKLAEKTPNLYLPGVAAILSNFAILLKRIKKSGDAEKALREAEEIFERLGLSLEAEWFEELEEEFDPEKYDPALIPS